MSEEVKEVREEVKEEQVQRVIHESAFYHDLKRHLLIFLGIVVFSLGISLSIYYKMDESLYFFAIGLPSFIVGFFYWRAVLRVPCSIVLWCSLEPLHVTPIFIPQNKMREWEIDTDHVITDLFGTPVFIADNVDFENKRIHTTWVHKFSNLMYVMTTKTFLELRKLLEELLTENAMYRLAFTIKVKEQLKKLTSPLKDIIKQIEMEMKEK